MAVSALVLVTACSAETSTSTTSPVATTTTATLPIDSGRLVVLDDSGDVVVMDPDGSNRQEITDDSGESAAYTQPVWSPDGESLAWGEVTDAGFAVGLHGVSSGEEQTVPTSNLPFYTSWSPDGSRLGVLHNGTTGVAFGLLDVASGRLDLIDEDAPFYFSWDPDSADLVTHAGADRVEVIDASGEATPLEPTDASYLAPFWTPRGAFHAADGSLFLETDDGRGAVADFNGLAMFVANDAGTRVAVQIAGEGGPIQAALSDPPALPGGRVVVVDLTSGAAFEVSAELALGFFWSPDGDSLLVLTPDDGDVKPLVWSSDDTSGDYPSYRPPATMLQDTFPFFPQYAQSVRFWSPDSTAFAFAGEVGEERGVWVQDVAADEPVLVSDGRWVAWSGPRDIPADQ
jgi:TolB protein